MRSLVPVLSLLASSFVLSAASSPPADEQAFRELYKELVEINTTRSAGSCLQAAEAMRARLLAAGIPARDTQILIEPGHPKDGALIAALPGQDKTLKPILLLAHLDVVEAKREDWQRDPFKLVEENGWFYARGASDDKAMAAVFTDALVRYKKEGFKARRGIKLALTCGEETPDISNSVRWLTRTKPEVLSAAFALNEGAGGELDANGKPIMLQIQAGEKIYQDFSLDVHDSGGHSSRPTRSNPITRLSKALVRLSEYSFPVKLNPTSTAYFEAEARLAAPEMANDIRAILKNPADEAAAQRIWTANPGWNGALRTTCVATEIQGGHAPNALPQHAHANVNCRILPEVSVAEVQRELERVLGDPTITVKPLGEIGFSSPVPALNEQILGPVRQVADSIWPGVPLVPVMSNGASDGRYLNASGVPTYGLSGMFHDAEGSHAHGLNERIRVSSLLNGRRFLYELVKVLANGA